MDTTMVVALIAGIVQAIKITGKLPNEYAPLVSIGLGIIFGVILNTTVMGALEGLTFGLMASGLYSMIKETNILIAAAKAPE